MENPSLGPAVSTRRERRAPDFYHDEAWESDETASDNDERCSEPDDGGYENLDEEIEYATQDDHDALDEALAVLAEKGADDEAYASDVTSQDEQHIIPDGSPTPSWVQPGPGCC